VDVEIADVLSKIVNVNALIKGSNVYVKAAHVDANAPSNIENIKILGLPNNK
jgi:hypothetical protein